jgi:hypothetical protein
MSTLIIDTVYTPPDVYEYAGNGDIDKLRLALAYGNNSTEWYMDDENDGRVALHQASLQGHIECMRELLDWGADIESKSNNGCTALMIAAQQGHIECMRELLERGADLESKSNDTDNAIWIPPAIALIVVPLSMGKTALFFAADNGELNSTRLLLDRGASIDENRVNAIEIMNQECKKMILDEVQDRLRRAVFDSFVNHHIEYQSYIDNIYSTCYPSGDLRVALPLIGWTRAEAVRDQYYFDEILFYVHLHVANVLSKSRSSNRRTRSASRRCSNSRGFLANNSDMTSTLMIVLADRLKMFLQPE